MNYGVVIIRVIKTCKGGMYGYFRPTAAYPYMSIDERRTIINKATRRHKVNNKTVVLSVVPYLIN